MTDVGTMTASEADYVRELRELEAYLNLEFSLVRGKLRPPLLLGGKFELRQLLGRGARGLVCLGHQLPLSRDVALKLYPARASERLIQSVAAEARALARFRHPAIVHVYSVEHAELSRGGRSVLYVEMELLERGTLRDWLKPQRTAAEILEVFAVAGEGLAAAHEKQLLHCDFKPDNVVFGEDGRPRVVDFGLARATAEVTGPPAAGTLIGTPAYAAPESFAGEVSARSDQYSYAASLWQALFGAFPYDETAADLRARAALREPPPRVDLPPSVLPALRHALAERPEHRHPDMRALLHALRPPASTAAQREWGTFTDERPEHSLRGGSAWPAALGVVALAAVAGLASVRHYELDGGWLDWSRPSAELSEPQEEPQEAAPAAERSADPPPPSAERPVPADPPPPAPTVPAAPAPAPATCPIEQLIVGAWSYETTAVWAAHAELLDPRGKYDLTLAPGQACTVDATVRKRNAGDPPPIARLQLSPVASGLGARIVADVLLMPPPEAAPAGLHYVFDYQLVGDRLLGHWRYFKGQTPVMQGILRGARDASGSTPSTPEQELPCAVQCAARCPGDEARRRCELEQCDAGSKRVSDCGAPGLDFEPPPATLTLDAPLSFFNKRDANPPDRCRAVADHLAGEWTLHARATTGEHRGTARIYTFRLRAEGCTLRGSDARLGPRDLTVSGSVRKDGRWTLHYRGDGFEGDWLLVGRDPAFGAFTAHSGVTGTVAAYRTQPP